MGIGVPGIILLVLIALLLFGPSKLPELGRAFGRTLKEFKNGAKDIMSDEEPQQRKEINSNLQPELKSSEPAGSLSGDNRRLPD